MVMIVVVISFLLVIVCGQDVVFQYDDKCFSVGDSVTMTAVYNGTGTVTTVQWYYSNQTAANLFIKASDCLVLGSVPPGYPDASRMSYKCPTTDSLSTNTFKLTFSGLKDDELNEKWGATFSLSALPSPLVVNSSITECTEDTTDGTDTTEEPCGCPWWCILIICCLLYLCGIVIGIFMYCCKDEPCNKCYVGDKIPCWVWIPIIIIVGLGILTVYAICKYCGHFGCCGCCGNNNDNSTQNEMPMNTKK